MEDKVRITEVYAWIINYYRWCKPELLSPDALNDIDGQRDTAYSKSVGIDGFEQYIKRRLTDNFAFLMRNVFYLNLEKFKCKGGKGTFFIDRKDVPVIREILLRSVSDNDNDLIIGRWLKGKVSDRDYYAITELGNRLFDVIYHISDTDKAVKDEWIEALSIVLRYDFAATMEEVEATVRMAFSESLPFIIDNTCQKDSTNTERTNQTHNELAVAIDSFANDIYKNSQMKTYVDVYKYIESYDFEKALNDTSLPPTELIRCMKLCEYINNHASLKTERVEELIEYFCSIDNSFTERKKQRSENDRVRYANKKRNKSLTTFFRTSVL